MSDAFVDWTTVCLVLVAVSVAVALTILVHPTDADGAVVDVWCWLTTVQRHQ